MKPITLEQWIALAPDEPRTTAVVYTRATGSQGFASPSPKGRLKFRALFRRMSMKARSLGFRKVSA